jgi:serine phosphatase RsbU (regulator of sigma subunit)
MAGTEPLIVLRAQGGEPEVLELPCIPLGVAARLDYLALPIQLAPGDTLIMLTMASPTLAGSGSFSESRG